MNNLDPKSADMTDSVQREIAEMEKHEVVCSIASKLGDDPKCLAEAETLFDHVKYAVTEYVLKHEFNKEHSLPVQVSLWLEQQSKPAAMRPLMGVIQDYLGKKSRRPTV